MPISAGYKTMLCNEKRSWSVYVSLCVFVSICVFLCLQLCECVCDCHGVLCWPVSIPTLSLCPPGQVPEEDLDEGEVDRSRAQAKPVCVNGTESKAKPECRSSSSSNPSRKGVSTASKMRKLSTCKQQWLHLNHPPGEKGMSLCVCVDVYCVGVIFFALFQKAFTPLSDGGNCEWDICAGGGGGGWMKRIFFFWREYWREDWGRLEGGKWRQMAGVTGGEWKTDPQTVMLLCSLMGWMDGREERNWWDSAVFCMSHLRHTTAPQASSQRRKFREGVGIRTHTPHNCIRMAHTHIPLTKPLSFTHTRSLCASSHKALSRTHTDCRATW